MILPGHVFSVVGDHRVVLYEFDSVLDTVLVPHHDPTDAAAFDGVLSKDEPKVSSRLFRYPHQTVECVDRMFVTSVVQFESAKLLQTIGQPGACWNLHIKPILDEHMSCEHNSCMKRHVGFIKSGRMQITMDYGDTAIIGPNEAFVIQPGHHGDVYGDETMVMYEFITGM